MRSSIVVSALAAAFAFAPASVLAGLENAKHSRTLTAANFDGAIAGAEKGALVAFYAPWCGHCKSLLPSWDKTAEDFANEDGVLVGHLDADASENKAVAGRYGVSGYPTIKFFPGKGQAPIDYQGARNEPAFLSYLNEHCGSHRTTGGLLSNMAGRIPSLDEIASKFLNVPTATRPDLSASASALAGTLLNQTTSAYYLKIISKLATGDSSYIQNESARLAKLAANKGSVAGKKLDELQIKQNILAAFARVQDAASDGVDYAKAQAGGAGKVADGYVQAASSQASGAASVAGDHVQAASSQAGGVADAAQATASAASDFVQQKAADGAQAVQEGAEAAQAAAANLVGQVKGEL